MSLERAYKNCEECHAYYSGSEKITENNYIKRILGGVNTNEIILGISSLFMICYLRNEAMKALEGETQYPIHDQDNDVEGGNYTKRVEHAKTALKICVSCDYTSPHVAEYLKTTKDINLMNIN